MWVRLQDDTPFQSILLPQDSSLKLLQPVFVTEPLCEGPFSSHYKVQFTSSKRNVEF